jgi:uncharacterized membrane protein
MNAAHWHLLVNHLPVIGTLFVVLLLIAGFLRSSGEVQKLSLVFAVVVALTAVAAYLTGDPAEHVVENLPGVTSFAIHVHEEFAEVAFVLTACLGGLALVGLVAFRRRAKPPAAFMVAVLVLALVSAGTMAWTANLGGKIRHTEIRNQPPPANPVSMLQH